MRQLHLLVDGGSFCLAKSRVLDLLLDLVESAPVEDSPSSKLLEVEFLRLLEESSRGSPFISLLDLVLEICALVRVGLADMASQGLSLLEDLLTELARVFPASVLVVFLDAVDRCPFTGQGGPHHLKLLATENFSLSSSLLGLASLGRGAVGRVSNGAVLVRL